MSPTRTSNRNRKGSNKSLIARSVTEATSVIRIPCPIDPPTVTITPPRRWWVPFQSATSGAATNGSINTYDLATALQNQFAGASNHALPATSHAESWACAQKTLRIRKILAYGPIPSNTAATNNFNVSPLQGGSTTQNLVLPHPPITLDAAGGTNSRPSTAYKLPATAFFTKSTTLAGEVVTYVGANYIAIEVEAY
jgi:hypothetical protein